MRTPWISTLLSAIFLILSSIAAQPQYFQNTTNLSTAWTNHESSTVSTKFTDGSRLRVILEQDSFACGFFCNGTCTSYLFAILITPVYYSQSPQVIWSANRDYPVREGAILNLTAAGKLILKDVDGSTVWTTNITEKSVAGMKLNDDGNLVLFDGHNLTVWQSFDHPTDCLLPGQKLFHGQKLIPSVSSTNWTTQKDAYYLQLSYEGLFAYVESNPPQVYFPSFGVDTDKIRSYFEVFNRSLSFLSTMSKGNPTPFVKLMPDGHLKVFELNYPSDGWTMVDLSTGDFGECFYPLACGKNAICSANQQCGCPGKDIFTAVNALLPNMGCSHVIPLTCNATQHQSFIEIKSVRYFTYTADMEDVDVETCKQACLTKCSCKAAVYEYGSNSTSGDCYLPSELFTMTEVEENLNHPNTSAFVKFQSVRSTHIHSSKKRVATILSSTYGSFMLLIVVVSFIMFKVQKQYRNSEMEEEYLDQVSGLPTRFSYGELKTATDNFSKTLGEGGFGSVFEGTLADGSRIAVKCLHGLVHVNKSFLAEVESIGSIHHVNLVRLSGFCAWSSRRLLVYEFMSNGSLDQWIYYGDRKHVLGWACRKKIILDIAKGLAYLHEDCRQKIIHLDIKPQNILLDEDFNAKVSDFGLSKLINRDQSQVITTIRGTPGYMAPEWLSSKITEKVDVYSFGIVLLEILCGRKNFDISQPEESWHLLRVFQSCWEQGTLLSIVDRNSEDMQVHGTEVMEMMKVASWCLQTEFTKRPSMSSVVKVLEGGTNIESNLDYNFLYPKLQKITDDQQEKSSKVVLPSILSGPRVIHQTGYYKINFLITVLDSGRSRLDSGRLTGIGLKLY